jgi:hypothetical protein
MPPNVKEWTCRLSASCGNLTPASGYDLIVTTKPYVVEPLAKAFVPHQLEEAMWLELFDTPDSRLSNAARPLITAARNIVMFADLAWWHLLTVQRIAETAAQSNIPFTLIGVSDQWIAHLPQGWQNIYTIDAELPPPDISERERILSSGYVGPVSAQLLAQGQELHPEAFLSEDGVEHGLGKGQIAP